jgi:hypothetical protein
MRIDWTIKRAHVELRTRAMGQARDATSSDLRVLPPKVYNNQITCNSDAATELNALLDEAKIFPSAFSRGRRDSIQQGVRRMREYLIAIADEYRDRPQSARRPGNIIPLGGLRRLGLFARGRREVTFAPRIRGSHRASSRFRRRYCASDSSCELDDPPPASACRSELPRPGNSASRMLPGLVQEQLFSQVRRSRLPGLLAARTPRMVRL